MSRTKKLLEQLLSLSRLEGDVRDRPETSCDVLGVLREVMAELHPLATHRNIDIGVSGAQACRVRCNPFDLRMLLLNALGNAIRHGREGGQVDVALGCSVGRMVLHVVDTGPGIAPVDLPHVFEPFYKAGEGDGTGLGLAIVKAVADAMQATVSLGPRPDGVEGCRFTLECPIAADAR